MAEKVICSSCKRNVIDLRAATFNCPQCGKTEFVRCAKCRSNAVAYTCPSCDFTGPN